MEGSWSYPAWSVGRVLIELLSGGYMGDLVFNGGKFGIWGGNQQYVLVAPLTPMIADLLFR